MAESVTYKLKSPVTHNGQKIEKVDLREPTARDMAYIERLEDKAKAIAEDDPDMGENTYTAVKMTERLSGLPEEALWQMTQRDLAAIQQALTPFLTGKDTGE